MLINCTNHLYEMWGNDQRTAAMEFGEVVDLPFPRIPTLATPSDIRKEVDNYASKIEKMEPAAVLVAGEFSFCFMLVDRLLKDKVKVVCSCSDRVTVEKKNPDGTSKKESVFKFAGFRDYEYY